MGKHGSKNREKSFGFMVNKTSKWQFLHPASKIVLIFPEVNLTKSTSCRKFAGKLHTLAILIVIVIAMIY